MGIMKKNGGSIPVDIESTGIKVYGTIVTLRSKTPAEISVRV